MENKKIEKPLHIDGKFTSSCRRVGCPEPDYRYDMEEDIQDKMETMAHIESVTGRDSEGNKQIHYNE